VDAIISRSEFYTAYTPYQPECSQGWLQAIYEYQTIICELTGLDVSNASLYDGGTAIYEAAMMAIRLTGRNKIIMDSGVNLIYRTMLYTYTSNLNVEFVEIPVVHGQSSREELLKHIDDKTAAVIMQNPNFFGAVDDHSDVVAEVHKHGALAIASVYPVSLGMLKAPGEAGFDIATGEGQSLGIPLSFGGPYLGFMAARKELVRQMPGRIVGATVDSEGKRGFVLTLQTREQHIRREKATSNICSNEALCALRAAVFVALLGKEGLKGLAEHNYQKAEFAKDCLSRIPGVQVKRSSPTFNEFTVMLPRHADEVVYRMIDKGFACGFPLGRFYKGLDNYLLIAVTEKRTKEDIRRLSDGLEAVL
jgi:glycine dehydrogenase subunit 1